MSANIACGRMCGYHYVCNLSHTYPIFSDIDCKCLAQFFLKKFSNYNVNLEACERWKATVNVNLMFGGVWVFLLNVLVWQFDNNI